MKTKGCTQVFEVTGGRDDGRLRDIFWDYGYPVVSSNKIQFGQKGFSIQVKSGIVDMKDGKVM